jgi:hypothetical protein
LRIIHFFIRVVRHIKWRISIFSRITFWQQVYALLLPGEVISGPFKGIKYIRLSYGSVLLPKLIGTYESELHSVIYSIQTKKYETFIDVGAAEGYYAVGIAKLLKGTRCIAFEKNAMARLMLERMAKKNRIILDIRGMCEVAELSSIMISKEPTLIIMDVEGVEFELFQDELLCTLTHTDLLIEVHPEKMEHSFEWFRVRFSATHVIQKIMKNPKKVLPVGVHLNNILKKQQQYLMDEFRGEQYWLWLESKIVGVDETKK